MSYVIWIAAATALLALYYQRAYSRFKRYGIKYPIPIPPFGNMRQLFLPTEHFAYNLRNIYNAFPEERFIGFYELTKPIIMLRDLKIIKKIAVEDFDYFTDHRFFGEGAKDAFIQRNLLVLKGQEWKDMRSTLSPAFTSMKIRMMLPLMEEAAVHMVMSLKKQIEISNDKSVEVDFKDSTSRYASDVIASCAYGVKVDSSTNRDEKFYELGKAIASFNFGQMLILGYLVAFPTMAKYLKLNLLSSEAKTFFLDLVINNMNARENHNINRLDLIHMLKRVRNKWSDADLAAQAAAFFFAGFETVSSTLSFALYEIAVHPEVQERLVQEIKETDAKTGGKICYDSIKSMKFLDMVFSEVLRLWPPLITTDRCCVDDYDLGAPNDEADTTYLVQKGDIVQIPIWAIQRDPKYHPDPEKFDPERFSVTKKQLMNPLAYLPFGIGARHCIGMKFAVLECKVLLYHLLKKIKISLSKRTVIPAQLANDPVNRRLKGGHWLKIEARI